MARIAPPVLSRLPRTVRPFAGETIDSYLARLAHANRVDATALRFYIAGRRNRFPPFPADRLATAAGFLASTLQRAIPDLSFGYGPLHHDRHNGAGFPEHKADDGPPCDLCVLARGITMPVHCWKHPEDVICLRHRRWTGPGSRTAQLDLSAQPDITQAHKRPLEPGSPSVTYPDIALISSATTAGRARDRWPLADAVSGTSTRDNARYTGPR
jgi:hypothetical protein